jgi:hypothetical protein
MAVPTGYVIHNVRIIPNPEHPMVSVYVVKLILTMFAALNSLVVYQENAKDPRHHGDL